MIGQGVPDLMRSGFFFNLFSLFCNWNKSKMRYEKDCGFKQCLHQQVDPITLCAGQVSAYMPNKTYLVRPYNLYFVNHQAPNVRLDEM